jgi:hypothetical protein
VLKHSYVHMHCDRLLRADLGSERWLMGLLLRAREAMLHMPRVASAEAKALPPECRLGSVVAAH